MKVFFALIASFTFVACGTDEQPPVQEPQKSTAAAIAEVAQTAGEKVEKDMELWGCLKETREKLEADVADDGVVNASTLPEIKAEEAAEEQALLEADMADDGKLNASILPGITVKKLVEDMADDGKVNASTILLEECVQR
jgi:hypothetical protein